MSENERQQTSEDVANLLATGEMNVVGRMPNSSNYTFLVELSDDARTCRAIYKPAEGERPLVDFPPDIYKREVAAYRLSNLLGWPNIPLTIERSGTFGAGSLQLFVDADFSQHYFTLLEQPQLESQLKDIAIFDLLVNNTDRKAGHCLLADQQVYAIDNGLSFHSDPKLRTVIWDFAGEQIDEVRLFELQAFVADDKAASLRDLISDSEHAALLQRIENAIDNPVFPFPTSEYQFPWPLL